MWVRSPGWEDPLEENMPTLSSILAWRIPWTELPRRLQSRGLKRVSWLKQLSMHTCTRKWISGNRGTIAMKQNFTEVVIVRYQEGIRENTYEIVACQTGWAEVEDTEIQRTQTKILSHIYSLSLTFLFLSVGTISLYLPMSLYFIVLSVCLS